MPETLQEVLARLADESRGVRVLSLLGLSDLSRSEIGVFREAWFGLSDERRVELLVSGPAVEVRAAAAISLGRFVLRGVLGELEDSAAQSAEDALQAAWQRRGEDLEVRRRALEALAPLGSAR